MAPATRSLSTVLETWAGGDLAQHLNYQLTFSLSLTLSFCLLNKVNENFLSFHVQLECLGQTFLLRNQKVFASTLTTTQSDCFLAFHCLKDPVLSALLGI